ncbi:MAG: helix-turn-helix domain-containing protein [Mycoplasmataceae bacterium]|jgi:transcriptional regulator with XRE-family HTH domain|nr:helix-turn-helix domain-containing protein [Mycoplasmataceae bacterium]
MTLSQKVGLRIKELRKVKHLTQEQLSLEYGERSYISKIETGTSNMSILNIFKVCKALKISLCDFFNCNLFK